MKKKRSIAILMALFFGWAGAHKFYLARSGSGIMYLILTLFSVRLAGFPISTVLGMIDAAALLMMDERTFDKKYNMPYMKKGYNQSKRRRRTAPIPKSISKRTKTTHNRSSNVHKRKGLQHLANYDMKEAIEELKKARELNPKDAETYFKLAGAHSLMEETSESLKNLEIAIKLGYPKEGIYSEDHLAYIRIHPAFDRFIKNGFTYIPSAQDDKKPTDEVILQRTKERLENRNR